MQESSSDGDADSLNGSIAESDDTDYESDSQTDVQAPLNLEDSQASSQSSVEDPETPPLLVHHPQTRPSLNLPTHGITNGSGASEAGWDWLWSPKMLSFLELGVVICSTHASMSSALFLSFRPWI
jgi:hypothetical protein